MYRRITGDEPWLEIGVIGTGSVGRTMAARLAELGHSVTVGTRDPAATTARTEPDGMGNPPFATWHAEHRTSPSRRSSRPRGTARSC